MTEEGNYEAKLTNSLLGDLIAEVRRAADALERLGSGHMVATGGGGGERSPRGTCVKEDDGRFKWTIPPGLQPGKCKLCEEKVYWVKSKSDKWVILGMDLYSHQDVCQGENQIASEYSAPIAENEVPF